jgi:hypothetical protein
MKVITILFFSALLISCNSPNNAVTQTEAKPSSQQQPSSINCYRYASDTDTITLKIIHAGSSITGTLVYNLKEKDRNKGTIQGVMKDNVLIADYTFMSEGTQSIRQVAFKLEGTTFIEGYGDSYEKNGKFVFKNIDSLQFNSSFKLSEVACK